MTEKTKKNTEDMEVLINNREDIAKALEILFASRYVSKKKLYLENFNRGIFFSIGGIIGATIILALIIWVLSLFDQVPLIGPFAEKARQTIESGTSLPK